MHHEPDVRPLQVVHARTSGRVSLTFVTLLALCGTLVTSLSGRRAAAAPNATPRAVRQDPARPPTAPAAGESRGEQMLRAYFGQTDATQPLDVRSHILQQVVATIPDPVASRLDWVFDQHVDALLRAHETAGFTVDRFHLPWTRENGAAATAVDAATEPGVFLLRKANQLRLLFLVGEVPTSGIHRVAFDTALDWHERAKRLFPTRGADDETLLRVVGPVFSGSSPSLRAALDRWLDAHREFQVDIVTGAATSAANAQVLADQAADAAADSSSTSYARTARGKSRIHFASTIHTDKTLLEHLHRHVLPRLGIAPHEAAVLQESSTQYGKDSQWDRMLVLPFPMNVSSLRTAYASGWKGSEKDGSASRIDIDLADRDSTGELPRALSPLSPAATDRLLAQLAQTLENHRIRLVVLFATDVRDKLFLGREIAARLPDIQLVTTEGNLLYGRSELADAQRGMLVLSTYPMFAAPIDWLPRSVGQPRQHIGFASDGAQGVYNATLLQLGETSCLLDYGSPITAVAGEARPPVWLTCVGKTHMLPVTIFPVHASAGCYPTGLQQPRPPADEQAAEIGSEEPGLGTLLLSLVLGIAVLTTARKTFPNRTSAAPALPPTHDAGGSEFIQMQAISNELHAILYPTLRVFVLTGLYLPHVLLLMRVANEPGGSLGSRAHALIAAVVAAFGMLGSAVGIVRTAKRVGASFQRGLRFTAGGAPMSLTAWRWRCELLLRTVVAAVALAFGLGLAGYTLWIAGLDKDDFEMFFHRATQVEQCVTPLLPLFLVGMGMAAWCNWHVRRVRLLGERIPFEAGAPPDGAFDAESAHPSSVRSCLALAVPDRRGHLLGAALLLLMAWLYSRMDRSLETLVGNSDSVPLLFDHLFAPGMFGLLLATGWAAYRMVALWLRMARCLGTGSARFVAAAKELVERRGVVVDLGLWRPSGQTDLGPAVTQALRRLETATDHSAHLEGEAAATHLAAGEQTAAAGNTQWAEQMQSVQRAATPSTDLVARRARIVAAVRNVLAVLPTDVEEDGGSADRPVTREAWRVSANELLAIEQVEWVRWTLSHLRTLAFFLLVSLLLTAALLWAYPFHPQELARITFLLLCAGVLGVLTYVVTELSRNPVLSRLTQTVPGQVTWDRSFVTNVLTYTALPALALVTSQVPNLGSTLFAWLDPLVKAAMSSG